MEQGDHGSEMFFILSGRLMVKRGKQILCTLQAGEMFGEIAVLQNHAKRTATVVALDICELVVLAKVLLCGASSMHATLAHGRT